MVRVLLRSYCLVIFLCKKHLPYAQSTHGMACAICHPCCTWSNITAPPVDVCSMCVFGIVFMGCSFDLVRGFIGCVGILCLVRVWMFMRVTCIARQPHLCWLSPLFQANTLFLVSLCLIFVLYPGYCLAMVLTKFRFALFGFAMVWLSGFGCEVQLI